MVLPNRIFKAARDGDRDTVIAYLKSLKDLKIIIERGGLGHADCLDRADLEDRAARAIQNTCIMVAALHSDEFHAEGVDLARLQAASNCAGTLAWLQRFKEAKSLMRKTIPLAQRVLGESDSLTLQSKVTYGWALYNDDDATTDDLSEAVTTLEDTVRIARRVLGGAHPLTTDTENTLRESRAALRARETPSPRT